ncbi:hypothetical protein LOC68_20565 [Blastopirellula sp. JC732]|uniref:Uncharacterized protein n=1 Tax=Blastopirellula sediminis TaxID=2894196 RepID=A0A9X1SLL4_9BACT|nr:hypothetical protein [Blastopirellula sediminis]MCC9605907.1 hypothetical protein [Blastopirellula sediminis]MCC9630794.1 hypothetical protein [Blastopirellula sediminis]
MTWLLVGGGVCAGVVLLLVLTIVALSIYGSISDAAAEKRIRENGKPVLAVLVMANSEFLRKQSIASAPALVIFTLEPPSTSLADVMRELASELFELYTAEPGDVAGMSKPQRNAAERLKDDSYREARRTRVPLELSSGRVIYMADIWIDRDRLPDHVAFTRVLACMATGQDEGEIMALPLDEDGAKRIYAAVGAS